jgi:hypothetical protein
MQASSTIAFHSSDGRPFVFSNDPETLWRHASALLFAVCRYSPPDVRNCCKERIYAFMHARISHLSGALIGQDSCRDLRPFRFVLGGQAESKRSGRSRGGENQLPPATTTGLELNEPGRSSQKTGQNPSMDTRFSLLGYVCRIWSVPLTLFGS